MSCASFGRSCYLLGPQFTHQKSEKVELNHLRRETARKARGEKRAQEIVRASIPHLYYFSLFSVWYLPALYINFLVLLFGLFKNMGSDYFQGVVFDLTAKLSLLLASVVQQLSK